MGADLADVAREARPYLLDAPRGDALAPLLVELLAYGVASCATCLDVGGIEEHGARAIAVGADEELLVEVLMLVSAVGVHALHEGVLAFVGVPSPTKEVRHEWGSYWERFDRELPGFSARLAHTAPWAHRAFLAFAGAAVEHGRLDRLTRELIWVSVDATPTHRYVPGRRLHLDNALRLGATREQLEQTLDIAAAAAPHHGVGAHAAVRP